MEIVVTVALVGIAGTAPLVAMQVAAQGAAIHQELSIEQAALSSAADLLSSEISTWESCTAGEAALVKRYQDEIDARIDLDVRAVVSGVDFWDGATYGPSCAASQGQRLQRITLEVVSNSATASIHMVKRPPLDEIPTEGTVAVGSAAEFENTIDHQTTSVAATTTTTTTTTTPTEGSVQCTAIVGGWKQQVDVVVRNSGPVPTKGWTIAVTYPSTPKVENTWNVEWDVDDDTFIASHLDWNRSIQPHGEFSFGVQTRQNSPKLTTGQSLPCIVRSS